MLAEASPAIGAGPSPSLRFVRSFLNIEDGFLLQNPSPRKLDRNAPTTIRPGFRADHCAASREPQDRSNTSIGGEPDIHRDFHSQGNTSHYTHVESPIAQVVKHRVFCKHTTRAVDTSQPCGERCFYSRG
jgi:hypothetical protein